ncbi:MAG: hypothetical protein H0X29_00895 [Parachlamydiaceae bacterium]|nr:hypothetical protein [Parachlamydiaceae bacterium]
MRNLAQNITIIDLISYPRPEEAIKAIKEMSDKSDILFLEEYLAEDYKGIRKYETLLAIKEDHSIVGFLTGKIKNECFSVKRLIVHENFRSSENNISREKIGTRLMLNAFEKTKILGKKMLTLKYDPGNIYFSPTHKANCIRNVAFYDHFKKFNLSSSYIDEPIGGIEGAHTQIIRKLCYYLTGFHYARALNILGFP